MKKVILTLAVLCGIGLMAGCKSSNTNENTNDNAMLIGEWQTVNVNALWICEENNGDYTKGQNSVDTACARLIGLNFIDKSHVIVKYHTHDCESTLPYLVNIDTNAYATNENYLWTNMNGDYEIMKLSSDTLVLRCYDHEEEYNTMETYTLKRR